MSTTLIAVHVGVVPMDGLIGRWQQEPLREFVGVPGIEYDGTSFIHWGETPEAVGEPHEVIVDVEVQVPNPALLPDSLPRAELERIAATVRARIQPRVPAGWRLVDYVVVTDARDHSLGARTVGKWGA